MAPSMPSQISSCFVASPALNLMFTKPERAKSSTRIDGISATVNALARATVAVPKKQPVYERRGMRWL